MYLECKIFICFLLQLLLVHEIQTSECPAVEKLSALQNSCLKPNSNLTLSAAFSSLKYHRKMMNEFLLSSYLAEIILNSSSLVPKKSPPMIQKRTGLTANETISIGHNLEHMDNLSQNMLVDEGSTKYKNWLEKTITYDDIQRQIMQTDPNQAKTQHRMSFEQMEMDDSDYEGEFDYGDITGYAFTNNTFDNYPYGAKEFTAETSNSFVLNPKKPIKKKNGYEAEYEEHKSHYIEEHPVPTIQKGNEIGLREIADITMITLAFLSFGTFILQVLICITMGKQDNIAMEASEIDETEVRDEEIRRRRRDLPVNQSLKTENELSRLALFTLDTILDDNDEDEACRNWMLCKNSHLAKQQNSKAKLWLPMWSLSLSWLRSRLPKLNGNTQNQKGNMVLFDNLKAIVLGITLESSCSIFYKDVCKKFT